MANITCPQISSKAYFLPYFHQTVYARMWRLQRILLANTHPKNKSTKLGSTNRGSKWFTSQQQALIFNDGKGLVVQGHHFHDEITNHFSPRAVSGELVAFNKCRGDRKKPGGLLCRWLWARSFFSSASLFVGEMFAEHCCK